MKQAKLLLSTVGIVSAVAAICLIWAEKSVTCDLSEAKLIETLLVFTSLATIKEATAIKIK